LIVASRSSTQGRSKASRTLAISALRIHASLAAGSITASARRTESSLTMPCRPKALAATASPRTPAMCAWRLDPARMPSIIVPSTSRGREA
jgi:hypothetical protein